jgi:protein SCO1
MTFDRKKTSVLTVHRFRDTASVPGAAGRLGSRRFRSVSLILLVCAAWVTLLDAATDVGIDEKLGATAALDSVLKDESGRDVALRQLIERPTILTLNYFRCAGICTPLLNGLAATLNQIELRPGTDFQVITVSFDPTDTPEMARQKRTNYLSEMQRPFPPKAWRFLTGTEVNTRALADSVGFRYRKTGDQYVHPGVLIVLSPRGVVSRYIPGVSFLPADLQIAIQDAAGGQVRPTGSRTLAFCYSYDPGSRTYVFSLTRLVATLTLVGAGTFMGFLLLKGRSRRAKTQRGQSHGNLGS